MVWEQWWSYSVEFVKSDPDTWGVYELADDAKNTVYYGSGQLKTRLLDHLNKQECPLARYYRLERLSTEAQCRAREEELLKDYKAIHGRLPTYNERMG